MRTAFSRLVSGGQFLQHDAVPRTRTKHSHRAPGILGVLREVNMFHRIMFAIVVLPVTLLAQTAPDATGPGPFGVASSEYKLPAAIDPIVLADAPANLPFRRIPTELWARVYRPDPVPGGALPLLVFLHGNHATCGRFEGAGQGRLDINIQYTFSGTCPPGFVVVPSHEGYGYLAERLASHGYLVVSLNVNRGVNA